VNAETIFHSDEWMNVLEQTYGFKRMCVKGAQGGRILLMEAQSLVGGKRGVSLPFTDHCEPLATSREEFNELWDEARELGRTRGWKYIELRGGKQWLQEAPASLSFHSHILDLGGGESAIFERFDSSVRRAIRKAQKSGVKVEISQDEKGMRTYYNLHCGTRKRHGLPPQPWAFFLNIARQIVSKGLGVLVLARIDRIAAAGAIFFCGRRGIYKFGASDESKQEARANNLVMWEGMRWLAGHGSEELDFGRTSMDNEGLRRFKAGWGSQESRLEYVKYDLKRACFRVDKDRASGWHNEIFSRMPIALLRAAGAVLYRQMT
jgi:hypothetical protein